MERNLISISLFQARQRKNEREINKQLSNIYIYIYIYIFITYHGFAKFSRQTKEIQRHSVSESAH